MGNGYIVWYWNNVTERLDKYIVETRVNDHVGRLRNMMPCIAILKYNLGL